ncbi:MAG: F0F1 ATP synthase subunit C [Sphaerospermopsis sp. SIO1G2]|nr:F0F1 ATP synthase subunit C [Sphaerospermopsis sp. SIO1G2]
MELESLKFIGAGLTVFGMMGAAIGVANIFVALLNGIARNPSAEPKLKKYFIIGAALSEFMGLLAFIVAVLILL